MTCVTGRSRSGELFSGRFPITDQAVTGSDCDKLCEAYGVVCQRRFEDHTKDELEALATGLVEKYGQAEV